MSPKVHASLASSSTLLASCFAAGTKSVYWELANHYSDLDFRDKQNKGGYFAVLPSSSSLALHTQTHTHIQPCKHFFIPPIKVDYID